MTQAVKVGLFVTVCLVVLGYLILRVEDLSLFDGPERRIDVLFDSVVGLDDKAPVRVAGVRVGRVDGISLEGQRAKVSLVLEEDVELGAGSSASIANAGILGDKYVELIPARAGAPPLPEGAMLEGTTPLTFDDALGQIGELAQSFGAISGDLADQNLGQTLARLLDNLEATSADVRELIRANRSNVDSTAANFERASATLAQELPKLSQQLSQLLAEVRGVVAENRGSLNEGLASVEELSAKLEKSAEDLNRISAQLASGEGSLGKLIYSDEAHDGLVSTLSTVQEGVGTLSETLGKVGKIDLRLGLEGSYFPDFEESRTALSLKIDPENPSRFYFVELVDAPGGRERRETEEITTTLPDGTVERTVVERVTIDDEFTLSAQFGFRMDRFQLRAGLIESSGGGALDLDLLDQRLRFSLEAFDFSREDDLDPHLRLSGRYFLNPNIYLIGGYDDFLLDDGDSVFFGAGIRWQDNDLKYLLGSVPRF